MNLRISLWFMGALLCIAVFQIDVFKVERGSILFERSTDEGMS
jgi:hypothetical protein